MDGGEASGGGGAETGEEAMDVAVTAQQGNVIATPDGTNTQLAATDAQSQDAHTPAAAALAPAGMCTLQAVSAAADGRDSPTWGDMEVSTTTTAQLQNISVTPCDPVTSTEEETQPEGDHTASKAAELHQGAVCKAEDDSEDSDSDSSSSTSSTPPSVSGHLSGDDDEGFSQPAPIRCRDELLMEELPAVEDVNVMLPEEAELQPVGTISSIVQQLVVVQSLKDTPALTEESILFRSDRLALAKVFEVFGPVPSPLYILRFNSEEQIRSRGLTEGQTVYCAPALKEFTSYILVQQLRLLKGSDASWKNDQEPPPEVLDFSDDEQEQDARRKLKNSRRKAGDDANNCDHVTQKPLQQQQQQQQQQQRHARPPFRRNKHPQHRAAPPHPLHPPHRPHTPAPVYFPPPLPPPPPFPHYPPPSFYSQPFSGPYWSPNSFPHLLLPPPPPPPHPPPPPQ